jgi:hypothetical protein
MCVEPTQKNWLLFDAIVATIAMCYMMENKNKKLLVNVTR